MGTDGDKIAVAPGAAPSVVFDGPKLDVSLFMHLLQPNGSHWANQVIPKATVEVKGATYEVVNGVEKKPTSGKYGVAGVKFRAADIGKTVTLQISHTPAESSTGLAGPSLGQAQNPSLWHFRPFEVDVELDANGIKAGAVPVVRQTVVPDGPPYALLFKSSPNLLELDWRPDFLRGFTRRPRSVKADIDCLVLHHTGNTNVESAMSTFYQADKNTAAGGGEKNAAHYVVLLDGHSIKLGHESEWMRHAGASIWQGERSANEYAIGIEILHENHKNGHLGLEKPQFEKEGFPEDQMNSVIRLVREIRAAYPAITRQRVVGHGDIACTDGYVDFMLARKPFEPDIHFEWKTLEDLGFCRKPMDIPAPTPPLYGLTGPGKQHMYGAKPGKHFVELKQDLFALGYSVSAKEITSSKQITDENFDLPLSWAIKAFESRYLSGSRAKGISWPRQGHFCWETAVLIKRVLADTGP